MKLQGHIVIPDAKLTQYLLVPLPENDKSKFLARAGFTQDNPDRLKQAIFNLIQSYDAITDRYDRYGRYYRVEGNLVGPNCSLAVVTIWIERASDRLIQFVTLKPKR